MFIRALLIGVLTMTFVVNASPAAAEYRVERQMTLRPGGTFMLDSDTGAVTITGDSPSGALISITSRRDDFASRYDVRFQEGSDGITVSVKRRGTWLSDLFRYSWGDNTRILIRVPRSTSTTIGTGGGSIRASALGAAKLRTSGGSIDAEEFAGQALLSTSGGSIAVRAVGGNLDADTSGGSIRASDIRGAVRVNTSGGSIVVENATGDVRASTSGGGVRVTGAGGRVDAHTSGGSVDVLFIRGNARGGDLATSGGGITAGVDPGVGLTIEAASSGGGVNADLPVTIRGAVSRSELKGDLNGGGPLLRMYSSGGGVRIASIH
jgi:DUF4097 and DUF4098 domain-containing protein YvlB